MRKLILSHAIKQKTILLQRQLIFACLFTLFSVVHSQAQSFTLTECVCQNNDSPSIEGLFSETVQVNNGGMNTWTIVQAIGIYDAASTPGNLIPFTPGDMLTDNGSGTFTLNGVREDYTTWYLELSDGTTSYPVASIQRCQYPGVELIGDKGVCLNSEDTYSIDAEASRLNNINWSLVGGGNIVSPNGGQSIDVEWGNIEGLAQISVTGNVDAYPNQISGQCNLNISQDIPIANEDTTAMACNNLLNISMNNNCELAISPDMILEDPTYPDYSYEIRLRDIEQDTIIPNGVISMEYLDKVIEVAVIHECSGNSCWGKVKLEDKNIPSLICNPDVTIDCDELSSPDGTGYPVPDDAIVTQIRDNVYSVVGFDKCTPLIMRYEDIVSSVHCDGEFSSVIARMWSIEDDAGNVDTCSSKIFIRKATLAAITFPENYDDNTGPNPSIQACSNFPTLPNGHPDPYAVGGTGAPEGMFCLNVIVDYVDIRIQKCKGDVSFKLRRKWTITDLCTAEQVSRTQFIVVVDKAPPVCVAPDEFEVGTQGFSCGSEINVPAPIVIYECSGWDYFVSYKLRDDSGFSFTDATTNGVTRNNDGTYKISNIPGGQDSVWIVYTIEDDCGNVSECFTEAAIIDNLPPVPVCDQNSFVALNDDGIAWAGVLTFDDGSHDNCAVDKLEIRRMNPSPCGDPLVWSDKLKFCCDDIGVETMISLRVTDKAGNFNTCMVFVEVQDNQPPVLKNCPNDLTVNCDADLYNLTPYGFPTVEDLCGADVAEDPAIRNLDHCGKGSVLRTFIATDRSGNTSSCTQTIYVLPTNPFVYNNIKWPADHLVTNGCMDSGTAPEDLPSSKRYPTYPEKPCSNVTHDYTDIVFQYTDGACFKILREWTVLDWCAYNGITGAGIYRHTQVIKVQNNIEPVVEVGCNQDDLEVTDLGNCRSRISLTAEGSDDCSLPSSLKWNYKLDLGNDGSVEYNVNSNRIDRVIDHGTFKVTWTVTDECDNSSSCSQVFTVDDAKKPTPYCLTEIVTVIMQVTKQVQIWASDFDRNSFDNCTPQEDLRFSFSTNPTDGFRTFTCDQLTDGELKEDIRIYVTDNAGNNDFCTATIRIQDNSGNCDEVITRVALGGKITNESNEVIEDIEVYLEADLTEFPKLSSTDEQGEYTFENLLMYTDYIIDPVKKGNYLEGVSTLDLVLIQRHILGISDLGSPYKVIAGDVNGDQKISASDLVELRKLILGVNNELPNEESWRFVDANTEFANPNKPFPYYKNMIMEGLDHDEMTANFIALKVGDVNNSHEGNIRDEELSNRSEKTWVLDQNSVNDLTKVSVKISEKALAGFQFAIEFDPEAYKFEGVEANTIDLNSNNIGLTRVDEGQILISWNSNQAFDIDGELITILLSNKSDRGNQNIAVNPGLLSPEAYNIQGGVVAQAITFRTENSEVAGNFELFQNIPNPFNNSTKIGFILQNEGPVSLKVFDYSGKLLLEKNGSFNKGYNSIDIDVNELNASGVMYYQIDTESNSASKKMIVIK